ncbi:MAG: GNAT family N-acetyltransferase [Thermodesulfobacteriota bacterium]
MGDSTRKTCRDKLGFSFDVLDCDSDDLSDLLFMYNTFFPEAVAQGLPPTAPAARLTWLTQLLESGPNFAAIQDGRVIGHAALLLERDCVDGEFLIFVGGPFRKRGIATDLTRCIVERALELGLTSMWLTVEADNFRAIKLYKKFGFRFCQSGCGERKMIAELKKD